MVLVQYRKANLKKHLNESKHAALINGMAEVFRFYLQIKRNGKSALY